MVSACVLCTQCNSRGWLVERFFCCLKAIIIIVRCFRYRPSVIAMASTAGLSPRGGGHAKICGVPIFRVDVDHGSKLDYVRRTYRASPRPHLPHALCRG